MLENMLIKIILIHILPIYLDDSQINMLRDNETYNVYSLGNKTPKNAISLILEYENYKLTDYYFKECVVYNNPSYDKAESLKTHETHTIHNLVTLLKNYYN